MRHNQYGINDSFIREPEEFDRNTEKDFLSYCLGGTLYMPAIRPFHENLEKKKIPGLTSMVMCFEDSIDESKVPEAEENAVRNLKLIHEGLSSGKISHGDVPLMFFRARNVEQFRNLMKKLGKDDLALLTGFVFPKFSSENGRDYYEILREANALAGIPVYGMPILEDRLIAYKETRLKELLGIRTILIDNKDLTLNVRVGGTDFSSCFGVRRGIDYSIYDIMAVRDCLLDIINVFGRDNDFVISGPVWEYFLASKEMKFDVGMEMSLQSSLLRRKRLIDEAIDGLLREVILDKANGFIGKTAIHPTHIKYINAMLTVTEEEYRDAVQILKTSGGVVKSESGNKMNEINPHRTWAKRMYNRARAYGVIEDETEFMKLVAGEKAK